jgi:hypothetical protein
MFSRRAGHAGQRISEPHIPMAAKKKGAEALELIRAILQKDRSASFAQVREQAERKGYTIYPIMYGRAQALEGIVKMRARGAKKAGKKKARAAATGRGPGRPPGRRGPGRPRKSEVSISSIEGVIQAMRENQAQLERYRRVIEQVQRALESVQ